MCTRAPGGLCIVHKANASAHSAAGEPSIGINAFFMVVLGGGMDGVPWG